MAERANKGILITTSAFTSDAIEFAHEKQIELIDGVRLIDLLEHSETRISHTPTKPILIGL